MTTSLPTSLTPPPAVPPLATSLAHANAAAPPVGDAHSLVTVPCAVAERRQKEQEQERQIEKHLAAIRELPQSGYFKELNPALIADQLNERVVLPYRVNQGNSGLCGAAAFTSTLAELRPAEYVKLAHDLLYFGKGQVGDLEVTPGDFVRKFDPSTRNIPAADWLVLASVRNDTDAKLMDTAPGQYGGTKTYELHGWLKSAGYAQVHYVVAAEKFEAPSGFFTGAYNNLDAGIANRWHPEKPAFLAGKTAAQLASPTENMNLSRKLIANDWTVIGQVSEKYAGSGSNTGAASAIAELEALGAPPETITKMKKDLQAEMIGNGTNHWAVVKQSHVAQGTDGAMHAGMTRYSWGTEEPTATVPMSQFQKMYGGMIAVSDDPQASSKWKR